MEGHDLSDVIAFGEEEDNDLLFRRLSARDLRGDGSILASHAPLKQWECGLSCDWSALASPRDTVRSLPNLVLAIPVWKCRQLGITIKYWPIFDRGSQDYNLAHCLLFMPTSLSGKAAKGLLRDEFLRAASYVITLVLRREPRFHLCYAVRK